MVNLALENPTFAPAMRIITAITNAYPAIVTTSFAHGYINGTIIRLYIPKDYGMTQANHLYAPIMILNDVTFSMDLDTTPFDEFVIPDPQFYYAQCVGIGEINSTLQAAIQNILLPLS